MAGQNQEKSHPLTEIPCGIQERDQIIRFEDGSAGLRTDKSCSQVPNPGPIKNHLKEVVSQIQAVFWLALGIQEK